MAGWRRSNTKADQSSTKTTDTRLKGTRRKLSLVLITIVLNVLLWSALICIAASLYQIISDPFNTSSYAQVTLTIISALVTIGYTFFHTILSFKQKLWEQQRRYSFAMKKNSSVPTRIAGSLCALWLLTSGWNMILVASTPICLQKAAGLQSWEYGLTCKINRVGVAFAVIALCTSIAMLGILAGVSRPFEAHLFNHGYEPPIEVYSKPYTPGPPDSDTGSYHYQEYLEHQWQPKSLHEIDVSHSSDENLNTPSPDYTPPPSIMSPPCTVYSPGRGVFTSHHMPPPIPAEYIVPRRNSFSGAFPTARQPHKYQKSHAGSSRSFVSGVAPGSSRQSLPAHLSRSTWHAVHPNPASLALVAHSRPDVSSARFSYQSPYFRSSISLTRPRRLSYYSAAPSLSSQTEHSDSDSQDGSFSRANSSEIARAFPQGMHTATPLHPNSRTRNIRITTTLDARSDAQRTYNRMSAPLPSYPDQAFLSKETDRNYIRSASPGFLSFFSPDSSPVESSPTDPSSSQNILATAVDNKNIKNNYSNGNNNSSSSNSNKARYSIPRKPVPHTPRRPSDAARTMLSNMPDDLPILNHALKSPPPAARIVTTTPTTSTNSTPTRQGRKQKRMSVYEEIKNKPLPRIAFL